MLTSALEINMLIYLLPPKASDVLSVKKNLLTVCLIHWKISGSSSPVIGSGFVLIVNL